MKKQNVLLGVAAGIVLLSGCMSFEDVKNKADAGDGYMAYRTGVRLKNGIGVKPDHKQACVYFGKAAKAGYEPRGLTVMDVEHRNIFGTRWDIAAAWEVVTQSDVEQSQLFGDCYEVLWNDFSKRHRNELYEKGLNYLKLIQMKGKDAETYALKKRLIAITRKKPSNTQEEKIFLEQLTMIKTQAEKRIAEQKRVEMQKRLDKIKYSSADLAHGMKLYKHITSGISLKWFLLETLLKEGKIQSAGGSDYYQSYKSTLYPDVIFSFSSDKRNPNVRSIDTIPEYNRIYRDLDLKGCLIEVDISFPENIDSKKIYQKFCKEYPHIKPTLNQKVIERAADSPGAYGYRVKIKTGEYTWKNNDVYISFSFTEIAGVTGPDPDKVNMLNELFKSNQPGIKKVLIRDEKLHKSFIISKREKEKIADKAAKDAEQNSALDF